MRTPGCGTDEAAWMPVLPSEPGVLGGVPGVLPGSLPGAMPLGVSQAERDAMPDGASDWRRARPELATVFVLTTGCGIGVLLGHWFGGGVGSAARTTVGCAGASGVTLMPGIVGRFFGND